ncbi:MAG: DNA-3-methyladenine glycosylase I [Actinobacteria bacterium]|nr:DNA-3-methyladenine glycosylase I [Actinomycetota bacterium]
MHDFTPLESGAPRQITPTTPADYFEVLTRAVFNAGMSWRVVQAHWPALADAFADFDPAIVAGFDEHDVDRLVDDDRLIQSRGKIAAIPVNARTFVDLAERHDGFDAWLAGIDDYDARERALCSHFRYIGEFGAFWCQYTWGMTVPDYRDWAPSRGRTVPAYLDPDT